jgi:hypothetical protein
MDDDNDAGDEEEEEDEDENKSSDRDRNDNEIVTFHNDLQDDEVEVAGDIPLVIDRKRSNNMNGSKESEQLSIDITALHSVVTAGPATELPPRRRSVFGYLFGKKGKN